jgi:hypothetical protein
MMDEKLHPPKAATRLLNILDTFCQIQALEKFPVNVDMLAYETANIFKWNDPINDIKEVNIGSFEGALLKKDSGQWTILYNPSIDSAGRILFTKAPSKLPIFTSLISLIGSFHLKILAVS